MTVARHEPVARVKGVDVTGPLEGTKVIELAGIGPGPFCAMMLADMGADVVRIDRADKVGSTIPGPPNLDVLNRGRRSVGLDLKNPDAVEALLCMVEQADALIEGFRPGVTERMGIGPDVCLRRNPRLIYGRMTGWGQQGPYSQAAGHDINYIALAGALEPIGRAGEKPVPPLNLVGDFGGGGMLLAYGVACALVERASSGAGQVVDAAMVDGAAVLMTMFHAFRAIGLWQDQRGSNLLDGGAWFYDTYETKDGKYISVGSLEPQFFDELIDKSGVTASDGSVPFQYDRATWPEMRERATELFKTKTRDEWCRIMDATDVCFAPVLSMSEAPEHPHNVHRNTFFESEGVVQPSPAPRFSRTPGAVQRPPAHPGQHTDEVLAEWGIDADRVAKLRESGATA